MPLSPPDPNSNPLTRRLQFLKQSLPHLLSKTDTHVSHLTRLLSKTSSLDTTLLTLTYTLHLLHAHLAPYTTSALTAVTTSLTSEKLSLIPHPNPHRLLLLRTTHSLSALSSLLDDLRITLRLFALPSILAWALSTLKSPPTDPLLRAVVWAQVLASTVFQVLENGAFLASKNVLDMSQERQARWWMWSARAWGIFVGLEFGRLGREWVVKRKGARGRGEEVKGIGNGSGGGEIETVSQLTKADEDKWWTALYTNAAYAPLTVHWSLPQGILAEGQVAALGLVAGWVGMRDAWTASA